MFHQNFTQFIQYLNKIFEFSYSNEWYKSSCKAKKLLIIIMLRSISPCTLTVGKIMALSLSSFSAVKACHLFSLHGNLLIRYFIDL